MEPNPDIRASDTDRDRIAAALREHCAQGRISMDELQERLDATYEARTMGQLQKITDDLPEEDLHELPVPARQRTSYLPETPNWTGPVTQRGMTQMWASWAAVSGINLGVWMIIALAGNLVYPWWIWVAGPWGLALLLRMIVNSRGD